MLIDHSPDLHSTQTTANLAALLLAPINSYQSVLTLLALQRYSPLLTLQPFSTRRSLAHALISSVLKNETIIETPEDVNGILELCHVLIRDQQDGTISTNPLASQASGRERRGGPYMHEKEEVAEEQGWIARMVHLFRADSLDVQFEACTCRAAPRSITEYRLRLSKLREGTLRQAESECVTLIPRSLRRRSNWSEDIKTANTWYT